MTVVLANKPVNWRHPDGTVHRSYRYFAAGRDFPLYSLQSTACDRWKDGPETSEPVTCLECLAAT